MRHCIKCGQVPTRSTRRGMCHRCYMNWWTRRRGYGTFESLYVDAEPARAHVAALRAAGLGTRRISALSGVSRSIMQTLTVGRAERGTGPSRRILAATADALLVVPIPEIPRTVVAPGARVDAIGTIRRCQALVAWGYTRTEIGRRIGWSIYNMGKLLDPSTGKVTADTAAKVAAAFRELQATPGPSVRARNEGARKGWALPLDWDEDELDHFAIAAADDPVAPVEPLGFPDRYDELRYLGCGDWEVLRRLNMQPASLVRQLDRYGLLVSVELRDAAREQRTLVAS